MLASAFRRTSQWVRTISWRIQDNLYWTVMELHKTDYYTNQIIITQSIVHSLHNQLLVMSSALLFLRYNISGQREFIVQYKNSTIFFFLNLGYNSKVIDAPSSGGQLRKFVSIFSESRLLWVKCNPHRWVYQGILILVLYWIASTCRRDGCSFQRLSPFWVAVGLLLQVVALDSWHQWKKISCGLGSVLSPVCSSMNISKTILETWDSDLRGQKTHSRKVQQHICRTTFISTSFWAEVLEIFFNF